MAPYGLLLLPRPPDPPSPPSLRAAYRPPLSSALTHLRKIAESTAAATKLDIVLPCPGFSPVHQERAMRLQHFHTVQRLVAGLYNFLASIYLKERIPTSGPGSIDSCIILVAYDENFQWERYPRPLLPSRRVSSVVDLDCLARSRRAWTVVFAVDGEAGYHLFETVARLAEWPRHYNQTNTMNIVDVPGGLSLLHAGQELLTPTTSLGPDQPEQLRCHRMVICMDNFCDLTFQNKSLLTAALFLLDSLDGPHLSAFQQYINSVVRVNVVSEEIDGGIITEDAERRFMEFFRTVLDFSPSTSNARSIPVSTIPTVHTVRVGSELLCGRCMDQNATDDLEGLIGTRSDSPTACVIVRGMLERPIISRYLQNVSANVDVFEVFKEHASRAGSYDTEEDIVENRTELLN